MLHSSQKVACMMPAPLAVMLQFRLQSLKKSMIAFGCTSCLMLAVKLFASIMLKHACRQMLHKWPFPYIPFLKAHLMTAAIGSMAVCLVRQFAPRISHLG